MCGLVLGDDVPERMIEDLKAGEMSAQLFWDTAVTRFIWKKELVVEDERMRIDYS